MKTWSDLQQLLQSVVGEGCKVYYQPPENLKLKYPCIVFNRSRATINHADNYPYRITKRYDITLITIGADNDEYLDKLLELPMCNYDRENIVNGLVHEYLDMYY